MVRVKDKKDETFAKMFQKIVKKPVGELDKCLDKNLYENGIELYLIPNQWLLEDLVKF